jgi:hypothetical protein
MEKLLLVTAIFPAILFVVLAMKMVHELSRRGVKINYLFIRPLIIKYMHLYRQITLKEDGKVGPLFYPCIGSINLALILVLAGLLV